MDKRKQIEEILLNDYGCFDDFTVDKLCDLFSVVLPKGTLCFNCKKEPATRGLNKPLLCSKCWNV